MDSATKDVLLSDHQILPVAAAMDKCGISTGLTSTLLEPVQSANGMSRFEFGSWPTYFVRSFSLALPRITYKQLTDTITPNTIRVLEIPTLQRCRTPSLIPVNHADRRKAMVVRLPESRASCPCVSQGKATKPAQYHARYPQCWNSSD